MDEFQRKKLEEIAKDLERQINICQYQALNNLDEVTNPGGKGPVIPDLDRLVKGPLMRALTRMKNLKAQIVSLHNS